MDEKEWLFSHADKVCSSTYSTRLKRELLDYHVKFIIIEQLNFLHFQMLSFFNFLQGFDAIVGTNDAEMMDYLWMVNV